MDSWQGQLGGARVLDLFAGSGAVGLEALGRGADSLLGLEAGNGVLDQLRDSYSRWSEGRAEVRRAVLPEDLVRVVGERRFDLVFADPPYDFDRFEELLAGCSELLAAGGELGIEHSSRVAIPARVGRLGRCRGRRYGESELSYYQLEGRLDEAGADE